MEQFFIENPEYVNIEATNKVIYESWKKFVLEKNGTFEGRHSGFYVEVESELETKTGKFRIKASRQLQSGAGSILPRIAKITTFTEVTKGINYSAPIVKITANSLLQKVANIFDFNNKKIVFPNSKYLIKTNQEEICKQILEIPLVYNALKKNELVDFLSTAKNISITFRKVFKNNQEIEYLISSLEKIDRILGEKKIDL